MVAKAIKVVIVDDSLFIRQMFAKFLESDPMITVVGTAKDPFEARQMIKDTNPDVVTLDVEMPKMDGLSFLEKIMTLRPMPVVMASSLTQKGADTTLKALEMGAVDYVGKPTNPKELDGIKEDLIRKVKTASRIKVKAREKKLAAQTNTLAYHGNASKWLIAIGASTGGVEAIREIVEQLPANIPPIVITQHMPPMFTDSFAKRLDKLVAPTVQEAKPSMPILPGNIYIAAGSHHLLIENLNGKLICKYDDGPPVSSHKPSVDVMFQSIAQAHPKHTIAAILTGMGRDGAEGLKTLRDIGVPTIGQNETRSVVYGMPKAAKEIGAVEKELELSKIATELLHLTS